MINLGENVCEENQCDTRLWHLLGGGGNNRGSLTCQRRAYAHLEKKRQCYIVILKMKSAFQFKIYIYNWSIQGQLVLLPSEAVSQGSVGWGDLFMGLWAFEGSSLRPVSGVLVILLWSAISPWTTVNGSTDRELTGQQKTTHLLSRRISATATVTTIEPVSLRGGWADHCSQCAVSDRKLRWNVDVFQISNKLRRSYSAEHLPKIIGTLLLIIASLTFYMLVTIQSKLSSSDQRVVYWCPTFFSFT